MTNAPDLTTLLPAKNLRGEDEAQTRELRALFAEAEQYLLSFKWCSGIRESYAGLILPGVVGVFLFRIRPAKPGVDEWIWVVVGDLPPAYLTAELSYSVVEALEAYVAEMQAWVDAVRKGDSVERLIPVNVAPTLEFADMLDTRLRLLREDVINELREG